MKNCKTCKKLLPLAAFPVFKEMKDGHKNRCLVCTKQYKKEVRYIYELASDRGLVVDHIVPLNSLFVCGLNVQDNLRCIPSHLNHVKSNVYWPDMFDNEVH